MSSLERFVTAQARDFDTALEEIEHGRKRSHWMWYVFPQIQGLGMSSTAQYYSIKDLQEARDFLAHPVLGRNLLEISNALLRLDTNNPSAVMGWPDDLKLCSCMTLFEAADPDEPVFGAVLDKFYHGERDRLTLDRLGG
ncbi:MAG: DUF1810 domain-containing protein [Candidatus Limivicinus sp.]|nr:DUF1810 domain-containing protein [Clostridiales bacterium]MDY3860004.1 DUF1810 domain-containing protein [Candidatus Limivicinus sp.]